jgi:hypothetical protein
MTRAPASAAGTAPAGRRGRSRIATDFLRPPATAGQVAADLVRVVAVLSVPAAGVVAGPSYSAIMLLVLGGALLPRMLPMRSGEDVAVGLSVLLAGWSSVLDLYDAISWWDLLVHGVATGVLAVLADAVLTRFAVIGEGARPLLHRVVVRVACGLALAVLWEMTEWVGHAFDPEVHVGYDDSIGDMAIGGLGALAAGLLLPDALRRPAPASGAPGTARIGGGAPSGDNEA